ncbi:hypothetical protein GCM10011399_33000 [Subtercola lobariae]|uniref:Uncharacterized protein n=1 Tax=Subtercola lobariae TaxID=1588641 RepID=A0A917BCP1_9MICO|nr:hypothetical protein GCM10011399_33000 [Subtercola lobariae]
MVAMKMMKKMMLKTEAVIGSTGGSTTFCARAARQPQCSDSPRVDARQNLAELHGDNAAHLRRGAA